MSLLNTFRRLLGLPPIFHHDRADGPVVIDPHTPGRIHVRGVKKEKQC